MSREVRMVPADWQHPKEVNPYHGEVFKPLLSGSFKEALAGYKEGKAKWDAGERPDYAKNAGNIDWDDWYGECPEECDYMPEFPEGTATHLMMYESVSEGTPISPAFETPEELARWLADNNASAFAGMGATYEQWLATAKRGWAPSAICDHANIMSGVEGLETQQ